MLRLVVVLALGQLPQNTVDLPQDSLGPSRPPVVAERPEIGQKLLKDVERLTEAINHLGDRLTSTERVAKYAARWVAKTIDTPPGEDTGLDGWQGKPPAATTPRVPAPTTPPRVPAPTTPPVGMVWCVECGAYMPASHFAAAVPVARPVYQPAAYQARPNDYPPALAAYRPSAPARAVQPARGRG